MRRCKKTLRKMIIRNCLKMGDFALSSGGRSNYFFDLGQLSLSGNGTYLIGKVFYHHTKEMTFGAIGGSESGTIPLVTAAVVQYWRRERRVKEGFWVRSAENAVAVRSEQLIEGRVTAKNKVVVIEGVCATGTSAALTVQAVQELVGCEVVGVVALVDREEGAGERFKAMGIRFESVFRAMDLLNLTPNAQPLGVAGGLNNGG